MNSSFVNGHELSYRYNIKKDDVILGISSYLHDSSICLLRNGKIVYASQEERHTRIKNDNSFPFLALLNGLNYLNFKYSAKRIISWLLIITAWGNTIGYNVAAFSGSRGLTYLDTAHGFGLVNKFIFFSFMVAVITILVALIFIIIGAFKKETK